MLDEERCVNGVNVTICACMHEYLILFNGPLHKSLLNCPSLNLTLVVYKKHV